MSSTNEKATVIFLPGLGADRRIFKNQTSAFSRSIVVEWIAPEKNDSIESYAKRLARDYMDSTNEKTVVCGLSFGGILAPYFAQEIRASTCILVSSARSPKSFPLRYYPAWVVVKTFPFLLYFVILSSQLACRFIFNILCFFEKCDTSLMANVLSQFIEAKTNYAAIFLKMLLRWAYDSNKNQRERYSFATIQIHGKKDVVLPLHNSDADIVLDGGHLLPLSCPKSINKIIESKIKMQRMG